LGGRWAASSTNKGKKRNETIRGNQCTVFSN
jgi:hypothetical protein